MTPDQIIKQVKITTGRYSESSFFRDMKRLKIKPMGFLTRPRQYSAFAVAAILQARGFPLPEAMEINKPEFFPLPPSDTAAARIAKLPTMSELRNEAKKARGAK